MFVDIEATGCPNMCRHCSVDGHPPYGTLYSIEELQELADEWGSLIYLHEPTAHPQFPDIFDRSLIGDEYSAGALPTCGFGIAGRDDHAAVLKRFRELGFSRLSFTFHGLRKHHDWFVGRRGAFHDLLTATRRATDSGFDAGWQIFIDRRGIDDVAPFLDLALRETGRYPGISLPYHKLSARLWRYEKLRPTLSDFTDRQLETLMLQVGISEFAEPGRLTGAAWLAEWRRSPGSNSFMSPFEPSSWPPVPPFEWIQIVIARDRSVYMDPTCTPRIRLGHLSEGKDVLLRRLSTIPAPKHVDLDPKDVRLTDTEAEQLHAKAFSLRNLAMAKRMRAAN